MSKNKLDFNGLETLITMIKDFVIKKLNIEVERSDNKYLPFTGGTLTDKLIIEKENGTSPGNGIFFTGNKQNFPISISDSGVTKGQAPSEVRYWAIGFYGKDYDEWNKRVSLIEASLDTNNVSSIGINAYNCTTNTNTGTCRIAAYVDGNGNPYTYAPTPASGDNSTKIATTAYVKSQPIFLNASGWGYSGNGIASTCGWGTLTSSNGFTNSLVISTSTGGGVTFADKSSQTSLQVDGLFYQNEGRYKVLDSSTLSGLLTTRIVTIGVRSGTISYSVTAPAVSGYTFCCWTHVTTINYVESGYMNPATSSSSTLWVRSANNNCSVQCTALYYRSSW